MLNDRTRVVFTSALGALALAVLAGLNGALPTLALQPTPTMDRLAAPPTVESPTQADLGAQVYWLNCQPCHGDRGQGLTDEWRAQYPPEDQYCWGRGCHGERPYENGFRLPTHVPAVIGPDALRRFATAADLTGYVSRAMPFQAPASLPSNDYWAVTAFLLRESGRYNSPLPLDAEAARRLVLNTPAPTQTPSPSPTSDEVGPNFGFIALMGGLAALGLAVSILSALRKIRH
jgi:cytochrome c